MQGRGWDDGIDPESRCRGEECQAVLHALGDVAHGVAVARGREADPPAPQAPERALRIPVVELAPVRLELDAVDPRETAAGTHHRGDHRRTPPASRGVEWRGPARQERKS